jgi:membrane-bound lytic murein transglycosylase MltF
MRSLAIVAALPCLTLAISAQAPMDKGRTGIPLSEITTPWTGDLPGMGRAPHDSRADGLQPHAVLHRRGTPRGYRLRPGKLLEEALNKKFGTQKLMVHVQFVAMPRNALLPALLEGRGDIVMADLTVTPERSNTVDFTEPWIDGVSEIVVTGPRVPPISSADDLSGKDVFVRESSSYYQSLLSLNARLKAEGKAPVTLTPAPEELEDEDLMEMANAGLVDVLVVDNHKAWFWQRVWPGLKVYPTVTLRSGAEIAWAVRKNSPELKSALNGFLTTNGKESLTARMIFRRYLLNTQYVKGAAAEEGRKRFAAVTTLFRKYGAKYNLDWMLMAAQGYQESRLDQNAKSHVGAIGVMQVMPATGAELNVGDITVVEPNVHAGVKYIRQVIDRNFANEPMDDVNKALFAFAAYNCGPGRVRSLRREATARGLNPERLVQQRGAHRQ